MIPYEQQRQSTLLHLEQLQEQEQQFQQESRNFNNSTKARRSLKSSSSAYSAWARAQATGSAYSLLKEYLTHSFTNSVLMHPSGSKCDWSHDPPSGAKAVATPPKTQHAKDPSQPDSEGARTEAVQGSIATLNASYSPTVTPHARNILHHRRTALLPKRT
ncbi:hypothetical protein EC968_009822 [Mortierella alpina]|nr:hypothetical protein EC968_009822 [Mortierella alpina]